MDASEKYKKIKKILFLILLANLFVAICKLILGVFINSASVTADGFHSLSDSSSNIVGLIGISIASKPIDDSHPYGHRKFETLTSLFIVGLLFYISIKIVVTSFSKIGSSVTPQVSSLSLIVMTVTLIINIIVSYYENKKGHQLNSMILISDSMHTRSDVFISLGVIATLIALKFGAPPVIDPLVSIIVAGFILHAALKIFNDASGILVDKAVIEESLIHEVAMSHKGVLGVHKIRSRSSLDIIHIDMHVLADPGLTLEEAHELAHDIEIHLQNEINHNIEALIHLEPYGKV